MLSLFSPPSYPEGLDPPAHILAHTGMEQELIFLCGDSVQTRNALLAQYRQRLIFLSSHLGSETVYVQWFEMLQKSAPFRSIRFNRMKLLNNLRIIYCIAQGNAYLLVAFHEKEKSDYARALDVAKHRFPDL